MSIFSNKFKTGVKMDGTGEKNRDCGKHIVGKSCVRVCDRAVCERVVCKRVVCERAARDKEGLCVCDNVVCERVVCDKLCVKKVYTSVCVCLSK